MMRFLNFLNKEPWVGFVMKSPVISAVGHHSTCNSFLLIRSVMKKYRMLMCLVRFVLEALPFFSKRIALLLS